MYDLETYENTFTEQIGGQENQYIKVEKVQQNAKGDNYAITYLDDGVFKIRTFNKDQRTPEEIAQNEFTVNKALGIDNSTMPNIGFSYPNIVSSFIDNDFLFVALFCNHQLTHYHFIYDMVNRCIKDDLVVTHVLKTNTENFPVSSFYNPATDEIYVVYRQAQAFLINLKAIDDFYVNTISNDAIGMAFLFHNSALIM